MTKIDDLRLLFPRSQDIPPAYRLVQPIHQKSYLVDGELKPWAGPSQTVYSPVHLRHDSGDLTALEIGSYPLCGAAQAEEALSAAVRAYDNGGGRGRRRQSPNGFPACRILPGK